MILFYLTHKENLKEPSSNKIFGKVLWSKILTTELPVWFCFHLESERQCRYAQGERRSQKVEKTHSSGNVEIKQSISLPHSAVITTSFIQSHHQKQNHSLLIDVCLCDQLNPNELYIHNWKELIDILHWLLNQLVNLTRLPPNFA